MNQDGITLNSALRRISSRVNTEFKTNNHLTFGFSLPKQWLRTIGIEKCRIRCSRRRYAGLFRDQAYRRCLPAQLHQEHGEDLLLGVSLLNSG